MRCQLVEGEGRAKWGGWTSWDPAQQLGTGRRGWSEETRWTRHGQLRQLCPREGGRRAFGCRAWQVAAELPRARGPTWECGGADGRPPGEGPGPWVSPGPPAVPGPPCDRRFHHSLTDHGRWVRERSHESYAKNYSVVFPHDEPLAGRNMRTDPLHEVPAPRRAGSRGVPGWGRR